MRRNQKPKNSEWTIPKYLTDRYYQMAGRMKIKKLDMGFNSPSHFISWSLNKSTKNIYGLGFLEIYNSYVRSNYNSRLTPSIDRIDNNKGYSPENCQWLTRSENCSKGNSNLIPRKNIGISYIKNSNRWTAYVNVKGFQVVIGTTYQTEELATDARQKFIADNNIK